MGNLHLRIVAEPVQMSSGLFADNSVCEGLESIRKRHGRMPIIRDGELKRLLQANKQMAPRSVITNVDGSGTTEILASNAPSSPSAP